MRSKIKIQYIIVIAAFVLICAGLLIYAATADKNEPAEVPVAAGQGTVRINEVMSSNSYFLPTEDEEYYDWLELYNDSNESVNIKGYAISDNTSDPRKWIVPEDRVIEPGEYLVIFMSGLDYVDKHGNLHTNFRLSSDGETLIISSDIGISIQTLEIPPCTDENISYGIDERGSSDLYLWNAEPSPGKACSGNTSENAEELVYKSNGIILNEYMTNNTYTIYDKDSEYSDWLEFRNPTDRDVSLDGCSLSDKGRYGSRWYFPENTVIPSGGYLIVFCSGKQTSSDGELHASFRLGEEDTSLIFFSPSGLPMTTTELIATPENVSCGINPADGSWVLFSEATPGAANDTWSYPVGSDIHATPQSNIVISEAMAVSSGMKGDKLTYDFIELYNRSSQELSLKGYGLSDSEGGAEFVFPDVSISAEGFIVVRCTGADNTADYTAGKSLTASFKLNQGGQTIYLYSPDGYVVDIFETGKQTYGVSRGRMTDDMSRWYYFTSVTPGKANSADNSICGYAPMPSFSVNGGIVEKGTVIKIQYEADCVVRYTIDGSLPTKNSAVYDPEKGIEIKSNKVIRAIAYKEDVMPSQVITATFMVGTEHTIDIVCLTGDPDGLFSRKKGIYSDYVGGLFSNKPNYTSDEERACVIEYFVDGKKALSFDAGTRMFGEGSRTYSQKSFAVILREKYGASSVNFPFFEDNSVQTFSGLVLRQSGQECKRSKLRDELSVLIVKNQVNCDYMDLVPVALYINGEYWGLYYIREKLNEDYLYNKYGYEKNNVDIIKYQSQATAGTYDGYRALTDYVSSHDLSKKKNYQEVCERINIDSLIDYWIIQTFCANNDTSNIRCYRNKADGDKWAWMLFDLDNAFYPYMMYNNSLYNQLIDEKGHGMYNECSNVIMRKLLKNKDFKQKFISRYCYHLKYTFAPERTTAILDELAATIESEIPKQYKRWEYPSVQTWEGYINDVRKFLEKRPEIMEGYLKETFGLSNKEFKVIYDAA